MTPVSSTPAPRGLPALDAESERHGRAMEAHLRGLIQSAADRYLPFEQWMDQTLYAPGLGYYAAGNTKFGGGLPTGDFTTAPELTPLFGWTLARQVAQVLRASGSAKVLEFGAGSGALAAALIPALRSLGLDPQYQILEVSADLKARQRQRLAPFGDSVAWLDELPSAFSGCVLANEVLDAMPVALFQWNDDGELMELGVSLGAEPVADDFAHAGRVGSDAADAVEQATVRPAGAKSARHAEPADTTSAGGASPFVLAARNASPMLKQAVAQRMPPLPGYRSEINMRAEAWVRQMGGWLQRGAALLIDYGFPQREYYHPQRKEGTLMCHFRHHAHGEPLIHAGLQDITAHVDFTAMADAALEGGLDVLGYTSQARFLMNAGLAEVLAESSAALQDNATSDAAGRDSTSSALAASATAQSLGAIQKLVSEAEMGELFKVLAIGRDIDEPLIGFQRGDRRDRL